MPARVSVLLPYRDAAATIEEALDSVLAQRGVDVEVLAVDDRSVDDGPRRVARLAARHPGLRPLRSDGAGIVAALETARRVASAAHLARMDADDVSLPDRFVRQVEALAAAPDVAAVGTRVEAFAAGRVGDGLRRYVAWMNGLVTPAEHARQIYVESPLCHPSVMLRRAALEAVGGWRDPPWPEDYDLWLRLHAAGFGLGKTPEVLLRWRHGPGRLTFTDPRYGIERLREAKAPHLARAVATRGRPLVVWGAGQTGRRLARALEPHGVHAARFVDIDPKKLGRRVRGVEVASPAALRAGVDTVVVAVGAAGARDEVRAFLDGAGWREGFDYMCAA